MAYSTGKTAVITGAASGIGRALAQQLNREGCKLYLADISPEGLSETLSLLPRPEIAAHSHTLDVADKRAVHDWAEQLAASGARVDILVNNAGVAYAATVADSDYEHMEWLININLWGVIYGTMAFLPLLQQSPQGHLVNISSVFGLVGVPTQSAYNAAKFGVRGFTEALRQEMHGRKLHVCCVHPGGISTNIARSARGGDPDMTSEQRGLEFDRFARTSPEAAAAQIIGALERRKKRLLIGADARYISLVSRLFPVNYHRFLPHIGRLGGLP